MPLVEYAARVLGCICEAALDWEGDPLVCFADYADLPGLILSDLVPAWSLTLGDPDLITMAEAGRRDAKNPLVAYDRAPPSRKAPPPAMRAAADRWLMPAFERRRSARIVPQGPR